MNQKVARWFMPRPALPQILRILGRELEGTEGVGDAVTVRLLPQPTWLSMRRAVQ